MSRSPALPPKIAALALGLLTACAGPPDIHRCEPQGAVVEPEFVRIGDDDLMLASMRYNGCDPFVFELCGIGEEWLTRDSATLGLWHDESLTSCPELILEDRPVNLRPLRRRYEDQFEVEEATLLLTIGSIEVEYSFAPPEDE
ncbi:MAG: hypothetical protein R3F61_36780 [Myxococcota bacterium]